MMLGYELGLSFLFLSLCVCGWGGGNGGSWEAVGWFWGKIHRSISGFLLRSNLWLYFMESNGMLGINLKLAICNANNLFPCAVTPRVCFLVLQVSFICSCVLTSSLLACQLNCSFNSDYSFVLQRSSFILYISAAYWNFASIQVDPLHTCYCEQSFPAEICTLRSQHWPKVTLSIGICRQADRTFTETGWPAIWFSDTI